MKHITASSKLTFGKHKGKKLSDCPTDYLQWVVETLMDSDFTLWAQAAQKELKKRKQDGYEQAHRDSLEDQADEILRKAGFKP
jgi:hypothetical protein